MTRLLLLFDHIVDFLISVVFIVLFLIGAYRMYDSYLIIDKASNRQLLAIKPESEVYVPVEIAEDSIAWLTLFDTAIDYPVMQGGILNQGSFWRVFSFRFHISGFKKLLGFFLRILSFVWTSHETGADVWRPGSIF